MNTYAASDLISVIIPAYNAQETLVTALDSVREQTGNFKFEVFVIDDGSTDHTAEVAQRYAAQHPEFNLIILQQLNQGVSAARNAGIKRSSGEYIALLDADDEWLPEKTEKQMAILMNAELNCDFVTSLRNYEKIGFPYQVNERSGLVLVNLWQLLLKVVGQTSTAIFRKEILERAGFFDPNQLYSEDANFWMRATGCTNMFLLSETLVYTGRGKRSFGESGLSANLPAMEIGIQKNIREMFLSKRINTAQYIFFLIFSKLKYLIRPLRQKI